MSSIRRIAAAGGVIVLSGVCATSAQAVEKPRFKQKKVICMNLGNAQSSVFVKNADLVGPAKPFGDLQSIYKYTLHLRGIYYTKKLSKGRYLEHFNPARFAVEGKAVATATKHPKKKAPLVSITNLIVDSKKTDVSWSFGLPASFGVSFSEDKRSARITNSTTENRKKTAKSFVVRGANAVNGPADSASDVYRIAVQSGVAAGKGTGPYFAPIVDYTLTNEYTSEFLGGLSTCPKRINFDIYSG